MCSLKRDYAHIALLIYLIDLILINFIIYNIINKSSSSSESFRESIILDRLTSSLQFDELTKSVERFMLTEPLERRSPEPITGERAIIAQLGSHGLRVALDCLNGYEPINSDDSGSIRAKMLKHPDEMIDAETPGVAEWAEDFGEALLNEALFCLGPEAGEKVEAYRNASIADEQIEIINWLEQRIQAMSLESSHLIPSNDQFYNPIRLSPKLIGSYPNHNLIPTCLGYSIIAASFFHQAGAPTLHAGVLATEAQAGLRDNVIASFKSCLLQIENEFEDTVPEIVASLKKLIAIYEGVLATTDRGYHDVVLTQLLDGRWTKIDPNYRETAVFNDEALNQRVAQIDDQLFEYQNVAPTLELTLDFSSGDFYRDWFLLREDRQICPSDEQLVQVREVLTGDNIESIPGQLYGIMLDVRKSSAYEQDQAYLSDVDESFFFKPSHGTEAQSGETLLGGYISKLITNSLLGGSEVAKTIQRCREDSNFLERKIAGFSAIAKTIPAFENLLLFNESEGITFIGDDVSDSVFLSLEIGRSKPRIAMTVLGDYASLLFDSPLPPSFWHSVWPSYIPATEAVMGARSDAQKNAAAKILDYVRSSQLPYIKNYDIVQNTIDDRMSEKE